jgi:hypothetical protein
MHHVSSLTGCTRHVAAHGRYRRRVILRRWLWHTAACARHNTRGRDPVDKHPDRNGDCDGNRNRDPHRNGNRDRYTYSGDCANGDPYGDAHPSWHSHADPNPNAHSHAGSHRDTDTNTHGYPAGTQHRRPTG